MKIFELITDPNFFFAQPSFFRFCSFTVIMVYRWLGCTVESKAHLRDYNMVGVRWWMYSYYCTSIYNRKI